MKDKYTIQQYGVGSVYIEEGMYTEKEIKKILKHFKLMNERAKRLMQDIIDASNTNKA